MLVSIDKYYGAEFYNRCLEALTNNGVPVREFINPMTYKWFLDVPTPPVMLNYDAIQENEKRFLLSKTIPVYGSDQYRLYRRTSDYGHINPVMIRADYMTSDSQYACFFNVRNRDSLFSLSEALNTKIFYLGKYYNNKYRIAVCLEPSVRALIGPTDVLYEKSVSATWAQTEYMINQKVFVMRDFLMKFTRTPYFEKHRFVAPNYFGEYQRRFFTF